MTKKILVVDDSASIRSMVEFTLKSASFSVTAAVDGKDALAKAAREPFDLVLTDQNMPNLTGLQLVAELRKLTAYRKTPLLVLTTESSDAMKQQGRTAGATGWLVKPFDPSKLLGVVNKLLG